MKRKILYFLAVIFCIGFSADLKAQDVKKDYDVILLQNGEVIKAKVIEITNTQVKYKDFDFQDGPTRNINTSEVFRITYKNGKVELFSVKKTKETSPSLTEEKQINPPFQSNQNIEVNQIEDEYYTRTGSWSFLTFANYDVNQFDFAIDWGFIVKF